MDPCLIASDGGVKGVVVFLDAEGLLERGSREERRVQRGADGLDEDCVVLLRPDEFEEGAVRELPVMNVPN